MKYFHSVHFHSKVIDVITYTYEAITMYFYELQVICTIDVTKVEHSFEIFEVFSHSLLSF